MKTVFSCHSSDGNTNDEFTKKINAHHMKHANYYFVNEDPKRNTSTSTTIAHSSWVFAFIV